MSDRHSLPSDAEKRPFIARAIRWLSVPIILGWLALTVVVNVVAPQLEEVGAAHSVAMTAKDAPSSIAIDAHRQELSAVRFRHHGHGVVGGPGQAG